MENPALSTQAIKQNYYLNRIKFNGKELQNKEFLDGTGLEDYDFGARMYDPQIARWTRIDPKSEKYYPTSPFNYVDNNPISRVDPTGQDWFYYREQGEKTKSWHFQKGNKATYTNAKGKTTTSKNGFDYLITFNKTGKNEQGEQLVLRLYIIKVMQMSKLKVLVEVIYMVWLQ